MQKKTPRMNNPSTELTFIPSLCLVIWPFCGFAYWMPRLNLLLSSTRSHLHKKWQGRWSQKRIIHGPMHDMVSGAPQDERRRSCSERGGGKGKCQGALKPQSPRRLPELNHLRSSLTGIDRHARFDFVPPPPPHPPTPPPQLFELQQIFYIVFSVE